MAATHQDRLEPILSAHKARRRAGLKQPIVDFLFEYYRFRPSKLSRWSPGLGVVLEEGAADHGDRRHFRVVGRAAEAHTRDLGAARLASTAWILRLLEETQKRPPSFGCHGLHEWAMLHQTESARHSGTRLRVSQSEIAAVLEAQPLVCTHYDAFRFFTESARPRNRYPLRGDQVAEFEQPGCLHVNMDVYRWAMKRYPWVGSDLIADAFLLAMDIRLVDMQASPYDLSDLGHEPIPVETASGRAEYRRLQADFHRRAAPLRGRLIEAYRQLLRAATESGQITPRPAQSGVHR
jgi:hypothetical protein